MEDLEYSEIKKIFDEYYEKVMYMLMKENNKSKRNVVVSSIASLNTVTSPNYLNIGKSKYEDYFKSLKMSNASTIGLIESAADYRVFLGKLANNTIFDYKGAHFPFYQRYKSSDYLPYDKIKELLGEFFYSFDDESIRKFIKEVGNNDIYFAEESSWYSGVLFSLGALKRYIIVINTSYNQNLNFASTIAHELGHAYEKNLYYKNGDISLLNEYRGNIFGEVISSFFEYAFINFLKEKGYAKEEIKSLVNNYFHTLFKYAFDTRILCKMNIVNLDERLYCDLSNKETMEKTERIKEKINFYRGLSSFGDKISFRDSFLYFVGELFAVYMYQNYKEDPKEFMRSLRTALVNYPRSGEIEAFSTVGIDKDKLLEGKVLRRELKSFFNSEDKD